MKWRIGSQRDIIGFSGRRRVGDASNAVGRLARIDRSQWQQGGRNLGCLLYTSPSPRDRSLSRMPSSA